MLRFFVLKGLKAKEIYEQLLEVYKESSPLKRTVEFWAGESNRGRARLEDDPREGRTKTATTAEIIEQYFTRRITYEKAVWKVSATHVNNSTKTGSKTNFSA